MVISQPNVDGFYFNMGHFEACEYRHTHKDRKDRKARSVKARVLTTEISPGGLKPGPDRGNNTTDTKIQGMPSISGTEVLSP